MTFWSSSYQPQSSVSHSQKPSREKTHLPQSLFQVLKLVFFDNQVPVIVEVFDDVVVPFFVVLENDGLDGGVALDEDT
jgi:hypothetical protein